MEAVRLSVRPREVLVDEKVYVGVFGLESGQRVTIQASVTADNGNVFASCGCYQADGQGTVDLTRTPASSGTYTGADAMGIFWSMRQAPGQRTGLRLMYNDTTKPQLVDIAVHKGHHELADLYRGDVGPPLVSDVITRWYKAKDVKRIPLTSGRLRGVLFIPPGSGTFPGVIDMFGAGWGLMEHRAALLASRGYVTMALPYFAYQDLQPTFHNLDLNYFKEAVTFLDSHASVQSGGLGVLGLSKGGELGHFLAIHCPVIKAVVSVNGLPYVTLSPIRDGTTSYQNYSTLDMKLYQHTEEGVSLKPGHCFDTTKFFKIWDSDAKFLSICGTDDLTVHPDLQKLQVDCFPANKRGNIELVTYEGAGHLIEPPYSPHHRATYHKPLDNCMLWGGNPVDHAVAQEDAWNKILEFFKRHLKTAGYSEENALPAIVFFSEANGDVEAS